MNMSVRPRGRPDLASAHPVIVPITVSPTIAEWILGDARVNRSLRPRVVAGFVHDMQAGAWDEDSPQPLGFDPKGRLCDGQHRMTAVVEADVTLQFWAALGMRDETIIKIDGGIKRTLADRFQAFSDHQVVKKISDGQPSRCKHMATMAKWIWRMCDHHNEARFEQHVAVVRLFSPSMAFVCEHNTSTMGRRGPVMTATMMAHHWSLKQSKKHVRLLTDTVEQINTSEGMHGNVARLHSYLVGQMGPRTHRAPSRDTNWVQTVKVLRAYRAILSGEPKMRAIVAPAKPRLLFESFVGPLDLLAKRIQGRQSSKGANAGG